MPLRYSYEEEQRRSLRSAQPEVGAVIDGRLKVAARELDYPCAWRGGQRQVVTLLAADADLFQSGNGRVDS
jgi:hypothetical protein